MDIKTAVPQGSLLSDILFIVYINDIQHVSKQLEGILFTDDSNLICSTENFCLHTPKT